MYATSGGEKTPQEAVLHTCGLTGRSIKARLPLQRSGSQEKRFQLQIHPNLRDKLMLGFRENQMGFEVQGGCSTCHTVSYVSMSVGPLSSMSFIFSNYWVILYYWVVLSRKNKCRIPNPSRPEQQDHVHMGRRGLLWFTWEFPLSPVIPTSPSLELGPMSFFHRWEHPERNTVRNTGYFSASSLNYLRR